MGTQQILLLSLTVAIVGGATIVGVQSFQASQEQASIDALNNGAVTIAASAQMWAQKGTHHGGGGITLTGTDQKSFGTSESFTGLSLEGIGYDVPTNTYCYSNNDGDFKMAGASGKITIVGYNSDLDTYVQYEVTGVLPSHISRTQVAISNDAMSVNCATATFGS